MTIGIARVGTKAMVALRVSLSVAILASWIAATAARGSEPVPKTTVQDGGIDGLRSLGKDFKDFVMGTNPKPATVREVEVRFINEITAFPRAATQGGLGGILNKELTEDERKDLQKLAKEVIGKLLSARGCQVVEKAPFVLLTRVTFDSFTINPGFGVLGLTKGEAFLVDMEHRQLLWYSGKITGGGRDPKEAVRFNFECDEMKKELGRVFRDAKSEK